MKKSSNEYYIGESMKIGIIGVGKLATVLVEGLIKTEKATEIILSPRNQSKSQTLSQQYECVRIAKDNQAVVDECDWVFLTLPTSVAESEIKQLTFNQNQSVINCVATLPQVKCQQLIGASIPVYRAFPLPSIAQCCGPLAFYPDNHDIKTFFTGLGQLFPCHEENSFNLFAAMTSQIASHYAELDTKASWLAENGMESIIARNFMNSLTSSLTTMAEHEPHLNFCELSQKAITPGGLNEQVLKSRNAQGVYREIRDSLDTVLGRVQQHSN